MTIHFYEYTACYFSVLSVISLSILVICSLIFTTEDTPVYDGISYVILIVASDPYMVGAV